jgi:hypothetical protein
MKLEWPDLLVEDVAPEEFERWIAPWSGFISGRVAPAFLNRFGVWFLRRPEGPVDMLDVFTGKVERVAETYAALAAEVNNPAWQETYLVSKLVFELHQAGKIPGPKQCYAVSPPAVFGGPNPMVGDSVAVQQVMVMDIVVWQSLCVQALGRKVQ